jgi:hypothetical protein
MQHEDRDKYLLGAAGLALAAAVGIAYQRRATTENGRGTNGRQIYRDGRWLDGN